VTAGKQGVAFTMDGATSSRELLTIDRSNLANNMWFPQEYIPGVSVSGESDGWTWLAGGFSAGEADRELGDFSAGAFALFTLGYDLGEAVGTNRALLRANYVYQSTDAGNTFTRQLAHVGSINLDLAGGRWGARADVTAASGYLSQSDLWGAMLMPWVNLTPRLQLVTRWTYVSSADPNGVRLTRYESAITGGRGDVYDELYLGASYYFYGHLLKLQGGVTLAEMKDEASDGGAYSGVGATLGLRIGW
jgi:phosphate-selective porin OprO/OprP